MILIVAPWSDFWLATLVPATRAWVANSFFRGAVTGIGVLTALAGLIELAGVFGLGRPAAEPPATSNPD